MPVMSRPAKLPAKPGPAVVYNIAELSRLIDTGGAYVLPWTSGGARGSEPRPVFTVVNAEGAEVQFAPRLPMRLAFTTYPNGTWPEVDLRSNQKYRSKTAKGATNDYVLEFAPPGSTHEAWVKSTSLATLRKQFDDPTITDARVAWSAFMTKLSGWLTDLLFSLVHEPDAQHAGLRQMAEFYSTGIGRMPMKDEAKKEHFASAFKRRFPIDLDKLRINARRYPFASAGRTGPAKLEPAAWDALVAKSETGNLAAIVERAMHEIDPQTKAPAPQRYVPLDIRGPDGLPEGRSIGSFGTDPEIMRNTLLHAVFSLKIGCPSKAAPSLTGGFSMGMLTAQIVAKPTGDGIADRPVSPCAVPPGAEPPSAEAPSAAAVTSPMQEAPSSSEGEDEDEDEDAGEDSAPPTPSPAPSSDGTGDGPFANAGRRVNKRKASETGGGSAQKRASRRGASAAVSGA